MRKAQAANMSIRRTLLGDTAGPTKSRLTGEEPEFSSEKELVTLVGKINYPAWLFSGGLFLLLGILLNFTALLVFLPSVLAARTMRFGVGFFAVGYQGTYLPSELRN